MQPKLTCAKEIYDRSSVIEETGGLCFVFPGSVRRACAVLQ